MNRGVEVKWNGFFFLLLFLKKPKKELPSIKNHQITHVIKITTHLTLN